MIIKSVLRWFLLMIYAWIVGWFFWGGIYSLDFFGPVVLLILLSILSLAGLFIEFLRAKMEKIKILLWLKIIYGIPLVVMAFLISYGLLATLLG